MKYHPNETQPNGSFYFVSDPVLLEILSLGSDPPSVVPHLQSGLFDAVASATFDPRPAESRTRIVELLSPQGERLRLEGAGVDARGTGAEVWLQRLVDGMRAAVRGGIRRAARDVQALGAAGAGAGTGGAGGAGGAGGGGAAAAFVFGAPAQAALLGLQLLWTADVQGALAAARSGDRAAVGRAFRRADALLRRVLVVCCFWFFCFFRGTTDNARLFFPLSVAGARDPPAHISLFFISLSPIPPKKRKTHNENNTNKQRARLGHRALRPHPRPARLSRDVRHRAHAPARGGRGATAPPLPRPL